MKDTEYRQPAPGGIENFQELRRGDFYYVDKTALIVELLQHPWKVTLFTRPRRFGKTLLIDTIRSFFEIGAEPSDFAGLAIEREAELCQRHMGQYPVIFLSLKGVEGLDYSGALGQLRFIVQREMNRVEKRLNRERLNTKQQAQLEILSDRNISRTDLQDSLCLMCDVLRSYYDKPVIILIDEYDVPLDKAFHAQRPYYGEMVTFLRGFLGNALKTNPDLHFAVLTGCLRIARESIFTGLNNFRVMTVSNPAFSNSFGFTEPEVCEMLAYYKLEDQYDAVRDWYDGYLFGNRKVFCPWDVINYIDNARTDPKYALKNYWVNSSGNDIVRRLMEMAGPAEKTDVETLIQGKPIRKKVSEELTYGEVYQSSDHIWSVLYSTGYLTSSGETPEEDGALSLTIPNREVRQVFVDQIWAWFNAESRKHPETMAEFCRAFQTGDAERAETLFGDYLLDMISIRDTASRASYREQFYHGLLLGLLRSNTKGTITSNEEAGAGYSDIQIRMWDQSSAMIIELKYAHDGDLDKAVETALAQIRAKDYDSKLRTERYPVIRHCGIGCYQKRCRIRMELAPG